MAERATCYLLSRRQRGLVNWSQNFPPDDRKKKQKRNYLSKNRSYETKSNFQLAAPEGQWRPGLVTWRPRTFKMKRRPVFRYQSILAEHTVRSSRTSFYPLSTLILEHSPLSSFLFRVASQKSVRACFRFLWPPLSLSPTSHERPLTLVVCLLSGSSTLTKWR